MRVKMIALAALVSVAAAGRAWACAACGCGDPTLAATGVEQPYKNRVRIGVDERVGDHDFGYPDDWEHDWTLRSSLVAAWMPIDRITLGALLPWVTTWQQVTSTPGTKAEHNLINGLGDLELSSRVLVARDRRFAAHHLFWLGAGLKLPTGPRINMDDGHPYSDDDQPGSGSWDPFGGATYAWFSGDKWSAFASASYRYTTPGWHDYRRGSSLGWASAVQFQPWGWGAFALGVDGAWTQPDSLSNGHDAPNTGGVIVSVAPALVASPVRDVLVRLMVDVPVVKVFYGNQAQGPQVVLSLAYDVH